jgi:hypothetical protein
MKQPQFLFQAWIETEFGGKGYSRAKTLAEAKAACSIRTVPGRTIIRRWVSDNKGNLICNL